MFAVIVGAGAAGRHLAEEMVAAGHTIAVVEKRPDRIELLSPTAARNAVEGDGADPKTLERAGIHRADVVVAVTDEDEDNLVVCSLAKQQYHVPRTVARVNNPENAWMYGKDLGVDISISQAHILSQLILAEVTVGELVTLLRLREGEVSLVEETISEQSAAAGRKIEDLPIPSGAVAVALLRGPSVLVPTTTLVLRPGDRLVFLAPQDLVAGIGEALG